MNAEGGPGSARLWAAILALAVVAAVFGYAGLDAYLMGQEHGPAGFWEKLYYTAQMFVLGSVPVDKPHLNVNLGIGLFLAPFTTVLAVLQAVSTVFRAQFVAWRLRRAYGHTVVVGAKPEALVLAQKLAVAAAPRWWSPLVRAARPWRRTAARLPAWGTTTVLVGSDLTPDVARRHGLHIVSGDPLDRSTLRAAGAGGAAQVFAFSDRGVVNVNVALTTQTLYAERRAAEAGVRGRLVRWRRPPHPGVAIYARTEDPRLVTLMRARRLTAWNADDPGGSCTVDFVAGVEQRAAAVLVDTHDDASRPATVIGSDLFATTVAAELTSRRPRGGPATVTVVPTADWCTIPSSVARVYVCTTDPDEALLIGLQLAWTGHSHVVLCLGRRSELADALEHRLFDDLEDRLSVFGVLDAACDPRQVRRSALFEQLARALHAHYLEKYPLPEPAGEPAGDAAPPHSHTPWDQLAEPFREDNRAQAQHIRVKLEAIGAVVEPATPGVAPFAFREEPGPDGRDEVEQLAEMEHERWMRVKEDAGFRWGPVRTTTTHPDCLPWARTPTDPPPGPGEPHELPDEVKEKDRMFVRELPALLAGEGLTIVRRPAERARGRAVAAPQATT